nr:unnamed protein product [Digitaria exilis]
MWWFYRKGPSGFSGASTAEEVTAGVDGQGLVAVVTGASSGIGVETARVLALRGVHVVMPVRNVAAGLAVRESIVAKIPGARIDVLEMDLSSMASVRRFASEFEALNLPLNILIQREMMLVLLGCVSVDPIDVLIGSNNAGVMTRNCTCSCDGLELHFATNHIGHFLLTNLLLENMKRTSRDSGTEGRIVNVTSSGHVMTYPEGIRFDKIHDPSGLNDFIAYGQSKLANILHAYELSRIFKGAATTCYVAMHPQVQGTSGKYFADCNVASPSLQASDPEMAKKLWQFSLKIVSS